MHISRVSLVNYRNFERTNILLKPGVNTIIGENGSGKSNLFRAIRLLLDDTFATRRHNLRETDFHRGLADWRGHWIVIMIEFGDVTNDESLQSLLLQHTADEPTGNTDRATYALVFRPNQETRNNFASLASGDHKGLSELQEYITLDDYERVLLGKMHVDLTDKEQYDRIVGNFDTVDFPATEQGTAPDLSSEIGIPVHRDMSLWREFSLSYVPALRNVVGDFNDPRKNPLRTLLAVKSEEIPEGDLDDVLGQVQELNESIEMRDDVQDVTRGIQRTFKDTVGETYSPTAMKIQSELPLTAADLFQSLKLYVSEHGDASPRGLHEMSLGGANLVYLTLKLLEFEYQSSRQAIANFLLIEEPEAHIHTHVQKTLFERVIYDNTQIIYSTHSTHISEVSEIQRINVLSHENDSWVAFQPSTGLTTDEAQSAQRFLDAIRSNLLFSRSILLVEGDAEEILIPNLVKKLYGISLDEIGISLINVRSTGFENLGRLFHPTRIRKRCAIITDMDAPYFRNVIDENDSQDVIKRKSRASSSSKSGLERKSALDAFSSNNPYIDVLYAPHTFEVDFTDASKANRQILKSTVDELYTQESRRQKTKQDLDSDDIERYGEAALRLANKDGKGWFALRVGEHLDVVDYLRGPVLPKYILDAIGFAAKEIPTETWSRILGYRITRWEESWCADRDEILEARKLVEQFTNNEISLETVKFEIENMTDPDDQLIDLIKVFER